MRKGDRLNRKEFTNEELEFEYQVYIFKNMFREIEEYIDLPVLTFEEFKKWFVEEDKGI